MEKSEEWGKRQKQELLDRIKQLEEENDNHKEEVKKLKTQLEQLTSQQVAQIQVPPKNNGIKHFFRFGSKK